MSVVGQWRIIVVCICFLPSVALAENNHDPARALGFKPHRATYDIKLVARKNSALVTNVRGVMQYEWQPTCDAWATQHQFDLTYDYVEGASVQTQSVFTTYERFDGTSLTFHAQRMRDGTIYEDIRGKATVHDDAAQAIFTRPQHMEQALPAGVLFPMGQSLDAVMRARKGEKFYATPLFDGSDLDGAVDVSTFILNPVQYDIPEQYKDKIETTLVAGEAWRMRLGFFPVMSAEAVVDYEMDVTLHETGVISDIHIDYGDFSITQDLVAVEPVGEACDNQHE